MNLKRDRQKKGEAINFFLLSLGVFGFVLFTSFEGGIKAWKWIFIIEEPDEWLIYVGPILITIFLTIVKVKRLTAIYMKS